MQSEDLREYFSKYGEVTDVFIPKPFRAFAFVTFLDPEIAQGLCGEDHIIKGVSVHVSNAAPKTDPNGRSYGMGGIGGVSGHHHNHHQAGGGFGGGRGPGGNTREPKNLLGPFGGGSGNQPPGGGHHHHHFHHQHHHAGGGGPGAGTGAGGAGGIGPNPGGPGTAAGGGWPGQPAGTRGNIDIPNLQALGITGQTTGATGAQNMSNPLGMGTLNLGALPMNPALVAAALNQAGWGLIGNLQGSSGQGPTGEGPQFGQGTGPAGFNPPPGGQGGGQPNQGQAPGGGFLSWMSPGAGSGATGAGDASQAQATGANNPPQPGSWPQRPTKDSFLKYD